MALYVCVAVMLVMTLVVVVISAMGIYLLTSSLGQRWAPPVRSSGKLKKAILGDVSRLLEKAPKGQKVVDLGSGWGTLLIPLAKKFPQHQFVGIERAFTPFYMSLFRARKLSNLKFIRKDFFLYDLSDSNVVMMFLIGFMMPKVTEKCLKELPKGAKVYASRFSLVGIEAEEKISLGDKMNVYYVYEM